MFKCKDVPVLVLMANIYSVSATNQPKLTFNFFISKIKTLPDTTGTQTTMKCSNQVLHALIQCFFLKTSESTLFCKQSNLWPSTAGNFYLSMTLISNQDHSNTQNRMLVEFFLKRAIFSSLNQHILFFQIKALQRHKQS